MVSPIGGIGGVNPGVGAIGGPTSGVGGTSGIAKSATKSDGVPFADLVQQLIQDTNSQQAGVTQEVNKLVTGESDSIHDVVMTAARADLAFQLVMEIRNKLISSYQEVMRMQV